MRKIYLIFAVTLIAVTLVGCSNNEIESNTGYPIEIASESSTELETAAATETFSSSAGSELFSETSHKIDTVAETETTAVTEDIPVEVPHTVTTEPQTEKPETTSVIIETYPHTSETTSKEPTTEKTEETTTTVTTKQEETKSPETVGRTEPPHTTEPKETTPQTEFTETTVETTVSEPIPEPVKSPYDAPFDIEYIKSELIALAESMGMTHRTAYKDGTVITPDNSSWELPITANSSFCGEMLKRSLQDYVSSYAQYHLYGGEPITYFTIYVLPLSDGYEIYFLH